MAQRKKTGKHRLAATSKTAVSASGAAAKGKARRRATPWLAGLALFPLAILSYLPAILWGGFVWDDVQHIPGERALLDLDGLRRIWFAPTETHEPHYRPLVYTSFWLEHKLWGFDPTGYHAVNVLLHAANSLLLWRILACLAVPGAWWIAAVFAVHPLHVESVAWTIERKDVLSGLFYLACVWAWLPFLRGTKALGASDDRSGQRATVKSTATLNEGGPGPTAGPPASAGVWRYCLALLLLTAGMLAKNMVVTLPAALVVLHWWQSGRVTWRHLLLLAPFFAVALGVVALDLALVTSATPADFGHSLAERLLIASRALWFYVGQLAWPAELPVIYPRWEIHAGDLAAWAGLGAAAVLVGALWLLRGRIGRGPLAGAAFYAVTLSPTLGFVDHTYMLFSYVADRYQYLAGIGPLAVVVGAAAWGTNRLPMAWRRGAAGGAAAALLLLGALTWRQASIYSDNLALFRHVTALNPEAAGAHLNLAQALIDANRMEEAAAAGRIAVRQRPDSYDAHINLGIALSHLQRFDEAERHFREAVEIAPRASEPHANLGVLLSRRNRLDEAEASLRRALEIDPNRLDVLRNLAKLLDMRTQPEAAIAMYDRLIEGGGADAAAYTAKGELLSRLQRHEAALVAWQKALSRNPAPPAAFALHLSMGRAAWAMSQSADSAAPHYEQALRIDPRHPTTLADLASLRIAQERHGDAAQLFRAAIEVTPNTARLHAGLGYALYRLGRLDAAAESLERALALDPALDEARTNLALVRRSRQ